jgi:prepilin-type N-terminal cleavage/methylation domain-containing protein
MNLIRHRKAFTLIELIIVVAIIVIISATAPMLSSGVIVERNVYNAATQVQQDLLLVQNLAITHSTDPSAHPDPDDSAKRKFEIYFYPSQNKYYVEAAEDAVFDPINQTITSGKVIVRQFSSALKFSLDPGHSDGWCIAFDNQGIPYPSSESTITISNINETKKLNVVISTIGRVKIDWVPK